MIISDGLYSVWKEAVVTSFKVHVFIILQGLRCVILCSSIVRLLIITCGTLLAVAFFGSEHAWGYFKSEYKG
jgi:hypothetical protein